MSAGHKAAHEALQSRNESCPQSNRYEGTYPAGGAESGPSWRNWSYLAGDFVGPVRAHIVTVVNSRTRGPAPIMMGSLSEKATNHDASRDEFIESEDGELYRLEIRHDKKVCTKPRHDSIKCNTEGGRSKTDKECFRCGRVCHIRADCRAKTHVNGRLPKSTLVGKGVGNCEEEEQQSSQNVPLGIIDLGSFEVLSDHGETKEDDVVADESSEENATVAISFLAQGNKDFKARRNALREVSKT